MAWYEIRVKSQLGGSVSDMFEGFAVRHEAVGHAAEAETILVGPVADQTALHGVLMRVRDLGLELITLRQIGSGQASPQDVDPSKRVAWEG